MLKYSVSVNAVQQDLEEAIIVSNLNPRILSTLVECRGVVCIGEVSSTPTQPPKKIKSAMQNGEQRANSEGIWNPSSRFPIDRSGSTLLVE